MPLATMPSAMDLSRSSLTLQPNLFQLFHPMGGVRATPLSQARASSTEKRKASAQARERRTMREQVSVFIAIPPDTKSRRDGTRIPAAWGRARQIPRSARNDEHRMVKQLADNVSSDVGGSLHAQEQDGARRKQDGWCSKHPAASKG